MHFNPNRPPERRLIDLRTHLQRPVNRGLYRLLEPLVEKSLAIRQFNQCYVDAATSFRGMQHTSGLKEWCAACLDVFDLTYDSQPAMLERIPVSGPLVIVANHPFGFADALVIGHLIGQVRPDARFLANSMLLKVPEVEPWIIAVDNFNGEGSERRNLAPMKTAVRHLASGGALIVFPAGEVAHFQVGRGVEECPWSAHVGALVKMTEAAVLPVHFAGRNSILFQAVGMLHALARTSLLVRELCALRGRALRIRVGDALPFSKLKRFAASADLTRHLRLMTLALGYQSPGPQAAPPSAPTIAAKPDDKIGLEIAVLHESNKLLAAQGSLAVYVAEAGDIPLGLREIGRLREVAFQAAGEGTGNAEDLDDFDQHYLHLILWDAAAGRIAGGYRMGRADLLLKARGSKGLYTHTLFRFSKQFVGKLDCALELGRSFVRPEYQRHPAALMLLWKGISAWILRHPQYKLLFGPVSISDDYDETSRRLMIDFLTINRRPLELRSLVQARTPFRGRSGSGRALRHELVRHPLSGEDELSSLVATIEHDRKGLPVLLRHYLKLNACLLSFNVDHDFSSVVDGLILVDLTKTEPRVLARYMGQEGARIYFEYHGIRPVMSA